MFQQRCAPSDLANRWSAGPPYRYRQSMLQLHGHHVQLDMQRVLRASIGFFRWAVFTGPRKFKRPCLRSWTAVFTEANHEFPETIRPLQCQGFVSLNVVDVVAPCSACHCFAAIASIFAFISHGLRLAANSLGLSSNLDNMGHTSGAITFSMPRKHGKFLDSLSRKRGQYLAYLLGSSMTSASRGMSK